MALVTACVMTSTVRLAKRARNLPCIDVAAACVRASAMRARLASIMAPMCASRAASSAKYPASAASAAWDAAAIRARSAPTFADFPNFFRIIFCSTVAADSTSIDDPSTDSPRAKPHFAKPSSTAGTHPTNFLRVADPRKSVWTMILALFSRAAVARWDASRAAPTWPRATRLRYWLWMRRAISTCSCAAERSAKHSSQKKFRTMWAPASSPAPSPWRSSEFSPAASTAALASASCASSLRDQTQWMCWCATQTKCRHSNLLVRKGSLTLQLLCWSVW